MANITLLSMLRLASAKQKHLCDQIQPQAASAASTCGCSLCVCVCGDVPCVSSWQFIWRSPLLDCEQLRSVRTWHQENKTKKKNNDYDDDRQLRRYFYNLPLRKLCWGEKIDTKLWTSAVFNNMDPTFYQPRIRRFICHYLCVYTDSNSVLGTGTADSSFLGKLFLCPYYIKLGTSALSR